MLTHLRIKNFKAWEDTGDIRLAPLTVIFGSNSAGKSSLGHFLLALKQTVQSVDRRKALHLGDSNSLIDLGTYEDCVYQHDNNNNIGFELAWKYQTPTAPADKELLHSNADEIKLTSEFSFNKISNTIQVKRTSFELHNYQEKDVTAKLLSETYHSGNIFDFSDINKFYQLRTTHPEKIYLFNHCAVETERVFNNIHYLGPLRELPKRLYLWAGDAPEDIGQRGENTVAAILSGKNSTTYTYKYASMPNSPKMHLLSFDELIAHSLYKLGLIHEFSVEAIAKGRKEHEVFIRINRLSPKVKISDVGFGISQALPIIVQAFYAVDNSTIIMEQPEIHLHPKVQADIADVFIDALHIEKVQRLNNFNPPSKRLQNLGKRKNLQFIIESHSEHLLTRLQRRIAEEKIKSEEVAIYFVDNKEGKATIEELRINEYGEIQNWPENFFGDEMGDLAAQALAAIERRQRNQAKG